MTEDPIPFVDLVGLHKGYKEKVLEALGSIIDTGAFAGGPPVASFEKKLTDYFGVEYANAVSNGTVALFLAYRALGISAGDLVITVPNTFIATTEAVLQCGATPAFVDVTDDTGNMDPSLLKRFLEEECSQDGSEVLLHKKSGKAVKAVVPVHLFGQCAEMDPIMNLCQKYGLKLVEDACQAHGARYYSAKQGKWLRAGTMGDAAALSFYPGKNLGAMGEGGAVLTRNREIHETIASMRNHGQTGKNIHDLEGYNGRIDTFQAAVLEIKLADLDDYNRQRREIADRFDAAFKETTHVTPMTRPDWSDPVYHLYVVRTRDRENLQKHLDSRNIATGIHYPTPIHLQKPYGALGYPKGSLPVAEKLCGEILSLPIYPGLTLNQQERIVEAVVNYSVTENA